MELKMWGTAGKRVRVVCAGSGALLASLAVGGLASGAGEPPSPAIAGDPVVGSTLTASPGDNFRWQRCDPGAGECGAEVEGAAGWSDIDGAGGQGENAYVPVDGDVGHLIRVLAKGAPLGSKWAASQAVGPVVAQAEGPSEQPIFDLRGNVDPIKGTVTIRLPNGEVREIEQVTQIPVGSVVDVSNGHAILTTQRKPGGPLQSTEEWGAAFVFDQKKKGTITQLTLVHGLGDSERAAAERRGHRRGLWGRGRCRCRTSGQNSSGTARGTYYLVKETAAGTVTRVKHGKVLVKNFNTGEKVLLKKGESYLAEKKKR